jgi:hypothetical protein
MTSPFKLAVAAFALSAAVSMPAGAVTIDFSGVQGSQPSPLVLPEATITNLTGTTVLVGPGAAGQTDGFCFLNGSNCDADGEMLFSSAVMNLSFDVDGWGTGDFVAISAFDGMTLLGTLNATANGNLDFSAFGTITKLSFDDSSSSAGVGYSTFLYDVAVPESGTLGMLALGLAGLGCAARRRKISGQAGCIWLSTRRWLFGPAAFVCDSVYRSIWGQVSNCSIGRVGKDEPSVASVLRMRLPPRSDAEKAHLIPMFPAGSRRRGPR